MKKIISILILIMFTLSAVSVSAGSFPSAFWAMSDAFLAAQAACDDDKIIETAINICNLLENSAKNADTIAVLGTRYQDIANAFERKGDFISASEYFKKYIPYGKQLNWEDGVRIAETKADFYTPILQTYLETDSSAVYFGAKHEPKSGVLYGQVSERSKPQESMILIYEEFGNPLSDLNANIINEAANSGKAVELAWNFPGEGSTAAIVPQQGEYITAFLQRLAPYASRTPIFLRIGAEMNVWTNPASPDTFINAYRTIAQYARRIVPEAALVWSVNFVSDWNTQMDAYYPGDEYVDWVGVSAYMLSYFQNKFPDENDNINEILFKAGRGAEPVRIVKEVVEKFGDRKPIMIAEGGVSHYNYVLGSDTSVWATERLKEYYSWLPMVYPQIKLIAYFNNYVNGEANNYALKDSSALNSAYTQATSSPVFIKNNADGKGKSYVILDGQNVQDSITVASYTHYYGKENIRVEYYVDDVLAATSNTVPYKATINNLTQGSHIIKTVAYSSDGTKLGESYSGIGASKKVTVLFNGNEINGDVPACVIDGRTMVPLRLIFDAMGASIQWIQETFTVKSSLGSDSIVMQVGNNVMIKNGEEKILDVPPVLVNQRTLVPVRAVAESYGADVSWNQDTWTVTINH